MKNIAKMEIFMKKMRCSGIIGLAAVIALTLTGCPNDSGGGDSFGAPTKIVATATSSSSIIVSWAAVSGALQYYVYGSSSASGIYSRLGVTVSTSYSATGLSSGTTYYFKVSAYNSAGESSQSLYVSGTTLIGAPTNISATASTTSITVSWSAVSGATGYRVYSSTSAYGTYTQVGTTSSTSYTATGLSRLTTYYYKVSAYNSTGESPQSSPAYATTALDAPANISATAVSSTSITVSWSEVSEATYYYVYYSTSASGPYTQIRTVSSTSYTVTGLSQNTTYYFKVSAYSSAGESSQSSYASATTAVLDAPTGVSSLVNLTNNIIVAWYQVSGATGYYVYSSSSASGPYTRVGTTSNNYWWAYTLPLNTTYYYKVSAYNSAGESPQSSYTSARTGS